MERLKPHMLKHCTGALSPTMGQWTGNCSAQTQLPSQQPMRSSSVAADLKEESTDNHQNERKKELVLSQQRDVKNPTAGPSSPVPPSNQDVDLSVSRSPAAALHALSFLPYGISPHQPTSCTTAAFLPPGFQSFYANSSKFQIVLQLLHEI